MKYKSFEDWFDETEIFAMRSERFYDEFSEISTERKERMIEWLRAAWICSREHIDDPIQGMFKDWIYDDGTGNQVGG